MPSFASFASFLCRASALSLLLGASAAHADEQVAADETEMAAVGRVRAAVGFRDESGFDVIGSRALPDTALTPGAGHAAAGIGPRRMVFSMLADVSARTSLVIERSRLASASDPARAAILGASPQTKVGVEFRPVSAASALKPLGALRVQMSDNASLSFRPRRGGMLVSWRSQF